MIEPTNSALYPKDNRTVVIPKRWDACYWHSRRTNDMRRAAADEDGIITFTAIEKVTRSILTEDTTARVACGVLYASNHGPQPLVTVRPGTLWTSSAIGVFPPLEMVIFLRYDQFAFEPPVAMLVPLDAQGRTRWDETIPRERLATTNDQSAALDHVVERLHFDEQTRWNRSRY